MGINKVVKKLLFFVLNHLLSSFVYALPPNIIRIHDVNPQIADWREESGQIISDTANLGILYTYYDDNILGTAGESFSLAFWVKRIATPLPEITNQISVLTILTSSNDIILKFGHDGKNLFLVDHIYFCDKISFVHYQNSY